MFIIYIKQAWQLFKEEKLFSALYIIGTGVAIALTMIISIFIRIQFASTYPEKHRSDILVMKRAQLVNETKSQILASSIGLPLVEDWLYPIKEAYTTAEYSLKQDITLPQSDKSISARIKYTDENFFKVFDFDFIHGQAFTEDARINKLKQAVISESFSKQLFGNSQSAIGKNIQLNGDITIVGVVKDAPTLTQASYASVYLPYSIDYNENIKPVRGRDLMGIFSCYIRAKHHNDIPTIVRKINEKAEQFNQNNAEGDVFKLNGQPDPYWKSIFRTKDIDPNIRGFILIGIAVFFILLGIPALNLNGMITSRMENLLPELGIRRAFGARKSDLLIQIFWENLLLTCSGGLFGLILAWIVLLAGGNFIFNLLSFTPWLVDTTSRSVSELYNWDMLLSPSVFLITFFFCCFMNLLSSLVPTIKALRKDIIYSLNKKI